MNKVLQKAAILAVLTGAVCSQLVFGMENDDQEKKKVSVYSHGFGEPSGQGRGPTYPDAPAQLFKAVFYTKPAVHVLANYLKGKVDEGYNAIDLEGRSCGAGTALNCLDKLAHYDQDPAYFNDSNITSKEDADAIVAAVNNGSLELTVPFLSLKKAKAVAVPSDYLGKASIAGLCYVAHRWGYFDTALEMCGVNPTLLKTVGASVTTGLAASYAVGPWFKSAWATLIDTCIIPPITRFHYNPFHQKPLTALEHLRGKVKCPVLIHQCMQDRVLENPDADTVTMYDALRDKNEDQTHIILSDNDGGWHNCPSRQHLEVQAKFKQKYGIFIRNQGYQYIQEVEELFARTKPTTAQLRARIAPTLFDRISNMRLSSREE